jgi:hypothetical protein
VIFDWNQELHALSERIVKKNDMIQKAKRGGGVEKELPQLELQELEEEKDRRVKELEVERNLNHAADTNPTRDDTNSTGVDLEPAAGTSLSLKTRRLLLQAKSESSESYVTIEMGDTHFLEDGKCAVVIKSRFFTEEPNWDRCRHLKLEYSFLRGDGVPHPNIELFMPRQVDGDDTTVTIKKEFTLSVNEPHAGIGGIAKGTKQWDEKEHFQISGQDFGGPPPKVVWTLSENQVVKKGIPSGFQGVVVLDSTAPFTLGIEVYAQIPGSVKEWFTLTQKGVKRQFDIDPKVWKAANSTYTQLADFDTWNGRMVNDSASWTGP